MILGKRRSIKGTSGQVFCEASMICFLVVLALVLNIEIVRRAGWETTLQYASFRFARKRAMGKSDRRARDEVRSFLLLTGAHGRGGPRLKWTSHISWDDKMVGKISTRFPSLLALPDKHHYEMTKACRF